MTKIFGTDGIRGIFGEKITADFVKKLAKSCAVWLLKQNSKAKVLIAHDTRKSFPVLEKAICEGLNEFGADAVCVGICPTPGAHYLVHEHGFDMAIMITASHNPSEYNGVKLITKEGFKFNDEQESEITAIFENIQNFNPQGKGSTVRNEKLVYDYADYIIKIANFDFNTTKVALDCANGANYVLAPYVFRKLGADVICINNTDNGDLINKDCGSLHLEQIAEVTKQEGCVLGFAFDGDADRVNAVYGNGKFVSGEELMFLGFMYLYKNNLLKSNKICIPYVTNCGIDESVKQFGMETIRCDVGGKSIQKEMLKQPISFGAEDNGHIVWGDYNKCSDGLLTAVLISKMARQFNLSKILDKLTLFDQEKVNVTISEEQKQNYLEGKLDKDFAEIKSTLLKNERFIVRVSGTEPLIRIVSEGEDKQRVFDLARKLENLVKSL